MFADKCKRLVKTYSSAFPQATLSTMTASRGVPFQSIRCPKGAREPNPQSQGTARGGYSLQESGSCTHTWALQLMPSARVTLIGMCMRVLGGFSQHSPIAEQANSTHLMPIVSVGAYRVWTGRSEDA